MSRPLASTADGGADFTGLKVEDLATDETDDTLVLAPDGAGGVEFVTPTGGSGAPSTAPYYVTTADAGLSAEVVVPAFIQTLLDDTTQGAARTTLGLVPGTDVPAAAHPHPLDAYAIDATYGDDFTAGSLGGIWTRRNYTSGAETYQVGPKGTYLRIAKASRTRGDGYFQTAPAGDWTFAMAFIPRFVNGGAMAWGIGVVDTNGTGVGNCFYGGPPDAHLIGTVTTYSTYGGTYAQPGGAGTGPNIAIVPVAYWPADRKTWVYLRKSGTSYYTAYSLDGEVWSPESAALTWAGTVDRVCMFDGPLGNVTSGTGTGSYVDVDWFNKIA